MKKHSNSIKWISSKERPHDSRDILMFKPTGKNKYILGYHDIGDFYNFEDCKMSNITHWAYLHFPRKIKK